MRRLPKRSPTRTLRKGENATWRNTHGGVVIEIRAATGSREGHVVSETTYPGGLGRHVHRRAAPARLSLEVGGVVLRNRIVSPPIERNYCALDGSVTERYIAYLRAPRRGARRCCSPRPPMSVQTGADACARWVPTTTT